MHFNANSAILLHIRSTLEGLTTKQALEDWKKELEKLLPIFRTKLEMEIFIMLMNLIDWKSQIAGKVDGDAIRIEYFAQAIEEYSQKEEFIEYFSTAMLFTSNSKFIMNNVDTIMSSLELSQSAKLIVSFSLAISENKNLQRRGVDVFKKSLQDYFELGKPVSFPKFFIGTALHMIRTNTEFKDCTEQVKFLVEGASGQLKESKKKPMVVTGESSSLLKTSGKAPKLDEIMENTRVGFSDLLREFGPQCSSSIDILKRILLDCEKIDNNEILKSLIAISEPLEDQDEEEQKIQAFLASAYFSTKNGKVDDIEVSERTPQITWNKDNIIEVLIEKKKIPWKSVFECLDSIDALMVSKETFVNFFELVSYIKGKVPGTTFPGNVIIGRWENEKAQVLFLENIFSIGRPDLFFFGEIKNKRTVEIDFQTTNRGQKFSSEKIELWSCLDLVERLIELSDSQFYLRIKEVLDAAIKGCPEILICSLSQIHPLRGQDLLDETFSTLFPPYFENFSNISPLINNIWRNNPIMLLQSLAQLFTLNNSSINLSKILDIVLSIENNVKKNSIKKVLKFRDLNFSISLAILASKREFLHLEIWLVERLKTEGDQFISALLDYIESSLLFHIRGSDQASAKTFLDNSHLDKSSLSIIFDKLITDKQTKLNRDSILGKRVASMYEEIGKYFADFSKLKSVVTEKETNDILTQYYNGEIGIDQFIDILVKYKDSSEEQEKDIFSCIIHNIFAEFSNYEKYSDDKIAMTGKIFGHIIKRSILDNVFLKLSLRFVMDSLSGTTRIKNLGLVALDEFKNAVHTNPETCKFLFSQPLLRDSYAHVLLEIYTKINQAGMQDVLPKEEVAEVLKKTGAQEKPKSSIPIQEPVFEASENSILNMVLPSLPQTNEERDEEESSYAIDIGNVDNIVLSTYLHQIYEAEELKHKIDPVLKKKVRFLLNNLDENRIEEATKELNSKMKKNTEKLWVSIYIIWERIPNESQYLSLYYLLIKKLNSKLAIKKMIKDSYSLIKICFDLGMHKADVTPEERKVLRNCGTWFGMVTLGSNKPILSREFNLKQRIYDCVENRTVGKIVPIICNIMMNIKISKIFKKTNPYVMAIFSILSEILSDEGVKLSTKASIQSMFTDLEIEKRDISFFGYIKNKRTAKRSKNKFFIHCLPNYIHIDDTTLKPYIDQMDIDLKQLVAISVDLAVKDITKPVLKRSVHIALSTTKELTLKDFGLEPDDKKLYHATRIMVTNLAGNLALVTCKEPLRIHIRDRLEHMLDSQTQLDQNAKDMIKDIASLDNLELACLIVKKFVIDKALEEVDKERTIAHAIEVRKLMKERGERYYDENVMKINQMLPVGLRGDKNSSVSCTAIYDRFQDSSFLNADIQTVGEPGRIQTTSSIPGQVQTGAKPKSDKPMPGNSELDMNQINQILKKLEAVIENNNPEEKVKKSHMLYANLSKHLQSVANIEKHIFKLAEVVLKNLFTTELTMEKLRYYSDVLVIYSNYNALLPKDITYWIFKVFNGNRYIHQIYIVFLRRNLIHLLDFDTFYAEALGEVRQNFMYPLNCIVQVLKNLVIEERIFTIYTFRGIVEKISAFHNTPIFNHLTPEITIFINNLIQYKSSSNDYIRSIKFRLTNLELEYKKLLNDVEDYFMKPDLKFYQQSMNFFNLWLNVQRQGEMGEFIKKFEEEITRQGDKTTICFFCYIFEISCRKARFNAGTNQTVGKQLKLDYTYIDLVSKMITILLKTLINYEMTNKTNLLEKILTAFIIVLTKEHHYNSQKFNQKCFFKILFSILYDLNRKEYQFKENIHSMLLTIVQTLHILQPIKYPGFAFSWLQLVSSQYLMTPLLRSNSRELCVHYRTLVLDLMIFYKEVFTIKSLNTPEMKAFYQGTLVLLLVLLHDFPDFLCDFNFSLLEEIPDYFMQVKNIIVSAYPKTMRIPKPFEIEDIATIEESPMFNKMPMVNHKIEERINSHNMHNLIMNCIKNSDQLDFETIKQSFYVQGYRNDFQINKPLLSSFVLYVPYFICSSNSEDNKQQQMYIKYKQDSYMLFIKLLKESTHELRDSIIDCILTNIRYPNQISFYFTKLIVMIFSEVDNDKIHEQIIRNLLERLIIEKPHPWGHLALLCKLFVDENVSISDRQFYKENRESTEQLLEQALRCARITNVDEQEENEGDINFDIQN